MHPKVQAPADSCPLDTATTGDDVEDDERGLVHLATGGYLFQIELDHSSFNTALVFSRKNKKKFGEFLSEIPDNFF